MPRRRPSTHPPSWDPAFLKLGKVIQLASTFHGACMKNNPAMNKLLNLDSNPRGVPHQSPTKTHEAVKVLNNIYIYNIYMFYRLVEFSGTIQLNLPTRQTKDVFRMAWGGILPCSRCKSSKIFAAPPPPHRNSLRTFTPTREHGTVVRTPVRVSRCRSTHVNSLVEDSKHQRCQLKRLSFSKQAQGRRCLV